MVYELSSDQRKYFGLEPIEAHWEKAILKGVTYRPDSIIYFDSDTIKRHIISEEAKYAERQYNELTRDRTTLLPKTDRGKEKKLSASVLESRQPTGEYCVIDGYGWIFIGSYNTQTTFYDSRWELPFPKNGSPQNLNVIVESYITTTLENYLVDINQFKQAKRKHCKFKQGDYFAFKVSRTQYGFGRIIADITKLKKNGLLAEEHGLSFVMGKPVLVKVYAHISDSKNIDVNILRKKASLPSDYMMDNLLLYDQFEIIGNQKLESEELDFPISYGQHIDSARQSSSFLQWGLIHQELSTNVFSKYFSADNPIVEENSPSRIVSNPYGYYSIGFYPKHSNLYEIEKVVANDGKFEYAQSNGFCNIFDLRNPANKEIREEIMQAFGLDPAKNYDDNCLLTNTPDSQILLNL